VTVLGAASPVPREARPYQGRTAGLVSRSVSGAVDASIVVVAIGLGALGWNGARFLLRPRDFEVAPISPFPALSVFLLTLSIYLAASWTLVGRTYGGRLMGLRVVDSRGRRVGPVRGVVRAALCVLVPLGLLGCVIGTSRRSLQDWLLATRVVYDWTAQPGGPLPEGARRGT
jgi:uncharacterized RDD family membrane protein YckC